MAKSKKPATSNKAEIIAEFDLTKLSEHPDNPRTLSKAGEKQLAASLDEFGMVETIVANRRADGSLVVLGGHQRLKVLLKTGAKTGPVSIVQVDEQQEKRLLVMLNGHHGQWDTDKLSTILAEITDNGDTLTGLGLEGVAAFESIVAGLQDAAEAAESATDGGSGDSGEVDVDNDERFQLEHRCPKCGFEYASETDENGSRGTSKGRGKKGKKDAADADAPAKTYKVYDGPLADAEGDEDGDDE